MSGALIINAGGAPIGLEEELTRLFHRRVDLGEKSSLKPHVRPQALREAQVIHAA